MSERIKMILDCDPGHDDAVALMVAGSSPKLELLGVTVVAGNQTIDNTVRNALHLVEYLGLDVPVYAGCALPMVRERKIADDIHGESGLDGPVFPPLQRKAEAEHAVNYLVRTLMASEGDIVVVTTGPMTNLAMALRMEPQIAQKISRIVLMGGSIGYGNVTPAAEFNIWADGEAAQVCFTCGAPVTMVGLDVTRKVLCYPHIVERMGAVGNRAGKLFAELMGHFCRTEKEVFGFDGGPLHDPVTVASLIDPELLTLQDMNVQIEIRAQQSYGRTNCDSFDYLHLPHTAQVAVDIDVERFWDIIEEALRRYDA